MNREYIISRIKEYEEKKIELDGRIAMLRELLPEMEESERKESFPELLNSFLRDTGMTLDSIAELIGYSVASMSNWKNGENIPYRSKWMDISTKLGSLNEPGYTQKRFMEALRNGLAGKEQSSD